MAREKEAMKVGGLRGRWLGVGDESWGVEGELVMAIANWGRENGWIGAVEEEWGRRVRVDNGK